ncbi:conjugal transfer protein TraX [Klebsiella sp. PL-2018]|uniref:conjugal transfer protein TraX n=1 Tax=Klebsiella TaxID=570 RepID=UPI001C220A91|nr:conjugal transfer protein TraX [Klebsiella sp. PL-2018]QXD00999.1 IncI1 plasmid conjugative transfer protein TraX [Klebsiella sp. PL-2018]
MSKKEQNPRRTVGRRLMSGTANIVLPVKETGWVIRAVSYMVNSHRQRLKAALPGEDENDAHATLSWAEAVAASGRSVPELTRRFSRLRRRWRVAFWTLLTLSGFIGGMALHASALPPLTLARLFITLLCLLACSGYCATRALTATYRLWQLLEKRVSLEEKGTFRDFLDDRRGWRTALRRSLIAGDAINGKNRA